MPYIHLFIGKGGVGKSTCSSIEALKLSSQNNRTLIDSMDPAHNLHDIFMTRLGDRIKKFSKYLYIRESDTARQSARHMRGLQNQLKGVYHYQDALNLDKYFNLLKHAPGMEEYAALLVLERCFNEKKYDTIVIDTPPTALTLKMLALPGINLHWIDHLLAMRKEIIDKKRSISSIRREKICTEGDDPVYQRLITMRQKFDTLQRKLQDKAMTEIVVVLNEDELSMSESTMIFDELKSFGLTPGRIIVNKSCGRGSTVSQIKKLLPNTRVFTYPLSSDSLIGIKGLNRYFQEIRDT